MISTLGSLHGRSKLETCILARWKWKPRPNVASQRRVRWKDAVDVASSTANDAQADALEGHTDSDLAGYGSLETNPLGGADTPIDDDGEAAAGDAVYTSVRERDVTQSVPVGEKPALKPCCCAGFHLCCPSQLLRLVAIGRRRS